MQGGIITAAIDNTVPPFSYVIAPPSITKEIFTKYKRPVKPEDKYIEVTATLLEKDEKQLRIQGEVKNEKGKFVALGIATAVYINAK
jgi:acyl-CoA thioesterase FadM